MSRPLPENDRMDEYRRKLPNGVAYVYRRTMKYNPEKHRCDKAKCDLIGKTAPGSDAIVPTRPKRKAHAPGEKAGSRPIATQRVETGIIEVVRFFSKISQMDEAVKAACGNDRAIGQKLLAAAWHNFCEDGQAWPGIKNRTSKFYNELPYDAGAMDEDSVHDLLVELGKDPSIADNIYCRQVKSIDGGKARILALDATTVEAAGERLSDATAGVHKDGLTKQIFKAYIIYGIDSGKPLMLAKPPGSIPDGNTVPNAIGKMKAFNIKRAEFIMDEGYSSDMSLGTLDKSGLAFATHIAAGLKWVAPYAGKSRGELACCRPVMEEDPLYSGVRHVAKRKLPCIRKRGSAMKGLKAGDTECCDATLRLFIYYSSYRKGKDDAGLRGSIIEAKERLLSGAYMDGKLQAVADRHLDVRRDCEGIVQGVVTKEDKVGDSMRHSGFLVLVANKEKDAGACFAKYRSRETVEEDIKNCRMHCGGHRARKWHADTCDGQLTVQFVGMCMRESFFARKRCAMQVPAVRNGDASHDKTEQLKVESTPRAWLRKTSLFNMLHRHETLRPTKTTNADTGKAKTVMGEMVKKDKEFFRLFSEWKV